MVSIWGGPSIPGTSYVYGHHAWGEFDGTFGQFGFARGGMGSIAKALANSAEEHGVEIKLETPVDKVSGRGRRRGRRRHHRGRGVPRPDGRLQRRPAALAADPASTRTISTPTSAVAVEGIDMRGSMARIHLLIDELPQYLPFDTPELGPQHHGHQMLGASTENYEKAWEAQRQGNFPDEWVIEAVIQSATDATLAKPGLAHDDARRPAAAL